jgi:uncharacterized protein YlzI (FlbEa/FlbD family)
MTMLNFITVTQLVGEEIDIAVGSIKYFQRRTPTSDDTVITLYDSDCFVVIQSVKEVRMLIQQAQPRTPYDQVYPIPLTRR